MEILLPILTLGFLGLVFGIGLAIASKKFEVTVDPRLDKIHGLLPGSNCGTCGGAGCFGFAEDILSGKRKIDACRVANEAKKMDIAAVLGRKLEKLFKQVAALHCNGGNKHVGDRFIYQGINDCVAANLILGGQKECVFGCIGLGTCAKVCPFDAISMSDQGLPVVNYDKCKACNKCVLACPKKLFALIPTQSKIIVRCKSRDLGKDTKAVCCVGCIACRICEKACKFDAIKVIDNLAQINYAKCTSCGDCIKACPMKTIIARP
jgi:electron transport complex protein RnfB